MSHEPYLDKTQTARLWQKIKTVLTIPLGNRVGTLESKAIQTTTDLEALTSRVDTLYLKYHTDVDGTTFNITFHNLSGLVVTGGTWNQSEGRIEF